MDNLRYNIVLYDMKTNILIRHLLFRIHAWVSFGRLPQDLANKVEDNLERKELDKYNMTTS